MSPVFVVILFFSILAVLISVAAFSQCKSVRITSAILAFGWACLMFIAARAVESLNHDDSDAEGQDREIKLELDLTIAGKGKKAVAFEDSDRSDDPFAE